VAGTTTQSRVADWGICPDNRPVVQMGNSSPITIRPAMFPHPYQLNRVFMFVGSGVEKQMGVKHPDEQNNAGNAWKFKGVTFTDIGSSYCPTGGDITDLCQSQV